MIGLGSNRLSVCRRGGMSVTQAGRGGMEWLAGGRLPRWASPYSAQATAALKAQFPTQWPTIRDYGFAHPALVPFINEDPMLVMSLIAGLGTRWLIGDGNSWIDSGRKATATSIYHMKWKRTENKPTWGAPFIGTLNNTSYSADPKNFCIDTYNGRFRYMVGSNGSWSEITSSVDCSIGKVLDTTMSGTLLKSNGVTLKSGNSGFTGTNYNIWFFARNMKGSKEGVAAMAAAFCETEDNSALVQRLIPFKSATREGMVDVINATFHPNQGTGHFTTEEVFATSQTP